MQIDTTALEKLVLQIWDGDVSIDEIVESAIDKAESNKVSSLHGECDISAADQLCKELELCEIPFPESPKTIARLKQIREHRYFHSLKYVLEDHDEFEWE